MSAPSWLFGKARSARTNYRVTPWLSRGCDLVLNVLEGEGESMTHRRRSLIAEIRRLVVLRRRQQRIQKPKPPVAVPAIRCLYTVGRFHRWRWQNGILAQKAGGVRRDGSDHSREPWHSTGGIGETIGRRPFNYSSAEAVEVVLRFPPGCGRAIGTALSGGAGSCRHFHPGHEIRRKLAD
jgi:hypothetical protein